MEHRLWTLCSEMVANREKIKAYQEDLILSHQGVAGKGCGSGPPSAKKTPSPNTVHYHDISDLETPEAIPQPFSKVALQAQKRLQGALNAQPKQGQPQPEEDVVAKEVPESVQKLQPVHSDGDGRPEDAPKQKKPRAASAGPMQNAYSDYLRSQKAEGHSHLEAMRSWRTSSERAKVMESLSKAEIKRRRYDV